MSWGVGCRRGLDLALLWFWRRPAATALIGPLAWEPPYVMGAALEKKKDKKKKKKKKTFPDLRMFHHLPGKTSEKSKTSSLTLTNVSICGVREGYKHTKRIQVIPAE